MSNILPEMGLASKLVVVTGASRGIGKSIAEKLASVGAVVVGTATSQEGADKITSYLSAFNDNNRGLVLDISSKDSIANFMDELKTVYTVATPDILINNAGITRDNLILRMKDDEWDDVINTNLTGVYYLIKSCIKGMVKQRSGKIINISSVVGSTGNPGQANYCAAKAGLVGMTKSLAREVASRGITVNCLSPGYIETDMTNNLTDQQKELLAEKIPLGKVGSTLDVANGVLFLASAMSDYITGHTLHVNGGMFMV